MNLLFNLLDVSLGFLRGLLFEVLNLLVEVSLNFTFFARQIDLVRVFGLPNLISELLA